MTFIYQIDQGLPHLNLYAKGRDLETMTTVISLEAEDVGEVTLGDLLVVHVQETMTTIVTTGQIVHLQERYVRDPDLVTITKLQRDLDLRDPDLEIVIIQIGVRLILMA